MTDIKSVQDFVSRGGVMPSKDFESRIKARAADRYCGACGQKRQGKLFSYPATCGNCGHTVFSSLRGAPAVAVTCILNLRLHEVLLLRNAAGKLIVPGGYIDSKADPGSSFEEFEHPYDGAVRELYEETGFKISMFEHIGGPLIPVSTYRSSSGHVLITYTANVYIKNRPRLTTDNEPGKIQGDPVWVDAGSLNKNNFLRETHYYATMDAINYWIK
jgi:8-oxo-dGTP pyrophosphatase MutT (NUDIX family)